MRISLTPSAARAARRAVTEGPRPMDRPLLVVILGLVTLGLIMAYSSTIGYIRPATGEIASRFFVSQVGAAALGLFVMFGISRIDYALLRRFALPFMAVTLLLLVAVLFTPSRNGARRWFGEGSFQPSELAKTAIVIYGATWLASRRDQLHSFFSGLLPFGLITGSAAVLIVVEPDFGTTAVVVSVAFVMFFLAGASLKHFLVVGGSGIALYPLALQLFPHAASRVKDFAATTDPTYWQNHVPQAKIAFALGNFFGTGLGSSYQKQGFLPLPHTDSIMAVLGEELGLLGLVLTLTLFGLLAWRCLVIGRRSDSHFGAYLAGGVMMWMIVQASVNMLSLMEVIPFTGIPVPFLSVGGSSLVSVLAACGFVLSVSRGSAIMANPQTDEQRAPGAFARTSRGIQGAIDSVGRRDRGTRPARVNNPRRVKANSDVPVLVGRDIRTRRENTGRRAAPGADRGAVRGRSGRYGGGSRPTG